MSRSMGNHDEGAVPPKRLTWTSGAALLDVRSRYVLIREEGQLTADADASRLHEWLDAWIQRCDARRVLFDGRAAGHTTTVTRDARWAWVLRADRLAQIALVAPDEERAGELNELSIRDRARARAFVDLTIAHRWLCERTDTFPGLDAAPTMRLRPLRAEDLRRR